MPKVKSRELDNSAKDLSCGLSCGFAKFVTKSGYVQIHFLFVLEWFLIDQILMCLVSLGFLVEKWPFCSTLVNTQDTVSNIPSLCMM